MQAVFLDQLTFSHAISFDNINEQVASLTTYPTTQTDEIIKRSLEADIVITNKVVLTQYILKQLPQLKLICIAATGTNNVDISAAKDLGIAVTNVSGYAKTSVAQYVFAQILEYYSQTSHHNNNCKNGLWQQSPTFCVHGNGSVELAGKKLAIIGYGNLGKSVADIAKAFGMEVLIAERANCVDIRPSRIGFKQALQQADIVSFHCPQTTETTNLINAELLGQMKNSAMLINTARGALVNNLDLLAALKQGQIAYAVLDVLDQEPPSENHPLITAKLNNLKITAHIAWASKEAQQRLINLIADNISAFESGQHLNRVD